MCKVAEVLSPAGSREALVAAVRSGADAVYFGAKGFSARRNAENFGQDEMAEAIRYCRVRGVKTYLAINIMIKDNELSCALETARAAYTSGVDGFIVSDLGLAKMLISAFPEAELHASTQMSVSSVSALPVLKEIGFCRVVAAREMNRRELKEFCFAARKLGMEVEVFVHGALCMSVSGQCLMSSVLGERSGNRGLCAGPCRLPFLAEGSKGFDLSLKDVSLYGHIKELIAMGVASLKIEGRMKRPEYIAAATAACRSAVLTYSVPQELSESLKNVFSRSGFTDRYFTGDIGREMFGVRTQDDVSASKQVLSSLHDIYRSERQSVAVSIKAEIKKGEPKKVSFSDGENIICAYGDEPASAINAETTAEQIKERLCKLGSTVYHSVDTQVDIDSGLFVAASAINNLRRELAERLDEKRAQVPIRKINQIDLSVANTNHSSEPKIIARFSCVEQIPEDISSIAAVILPDSECLKVSRQFSCEVIAQMPRYITDEQVIERRMAALKEKGIGTVCCGNLAGVGLAKKHGFKILGDIGLNICNEQSAKQAHTIGLDTLLLSAEISLSAAIKMKTPIPKGIFAYGRLPLMLLKNCPLKNGRECGSCDKRGFVTDRKNIKFPISCSGAYCELLNSKPLYLADRLKETAGLDFLLLYFSTEERQETERIIGAYTDKGTDFVCEEYTRGLYFRNLI